MSDAEQAERRIGTTLRDKWTLQKLLGVGGMASVYLARHKIGRLDAIKILHSEISHSPILRQRFEQEAHVVNQFHHKGAVEIRDIDTSEDGAPFLVMELLEGESLSQLVRSKGPLDPERVLRIADETLDVLAAAHARGIIHRDIKPDNLFIQKDGSVKVLDFGIARLREGTGDKGEKRYRTKTGTTLGTASYMAPEQARGIAEIDGRVDLYAVGATMFRVLTNRRVHEADTQVELLMKLVSDPAPKLASVAPSLPAPLCAVVDRALAFERNERYPDAASMQADVRLALRGELPVRVDAAPPTVAPQLQRPITAATAITPPVQAQPVPQPKPKPEPPPPAAPAPAPKADHPATVVRHGPPATVVAAPAPADLRASVPSVRAPIPQPAPAIMQPSPAAQPRPSGELFGIRLTPLVIAASALVLLLMLGGMLLVAVAAMSTFRAAPALAPPATDTATGAATGTATATATGAATGTATGAATATATAAATATATAAATATVAATATATATATTARTTPPPPVGTGNPGKGNKKKDK